MEVSGPKAHSRSGVWNQKPQILGALLEVVAKTLECRSLSELPPLWEQQLRPTPTCSFEQHLSSTALLQVVLRGELVPKSHLF